MTLADWSDLDFPILIDDCLLHTGSGRIFVYICSRPHIILAELNTHREVVAFWKRKSRDPSLKFVTWNDCWDLITEGQAQDWSFGAK